MTEVRVHGRGGQGVVSFATLLSVAAFLDGRESQMLPSFGPERTGAPIEAYVRVDDRPIRTREPVSRPDDLVVLDPTLLGHVDVLAGLAPGGRVLVATGRAVADLPVLSGIVGPTEVRTVDPAGAVDPETGRRLVNTYLLGAFAALTGLVSPEAVEAAIAARFPDSRGANTAAARAGYAAIAATAAPRPPEHAGAVGSGA